MASKKRLKSKKTAKAAPVAAVRNRVSSTPPESPTAAAIKRSKARVGVALIARSAKVTSPLSEPVAQPKQARVTTPTVASIKQRCDKWVAEQTVQSIPRISVRKRAIPGHSPRVIEAAARLHQAKRSAKKPANPIRKRFSIISAFIAALKLRINRWTGDQRVVTPVTSSKLLTSPISVQYGSQAHKKWDKTWSQRRLAALIELERQWEVRGIDVERWKLRQQQRIGHALCATTPEDLLAVARICFYQSLLDKDIDLSLLSPLDPDSAHVLDLQAQVEPPGDLLDSEPPNESAARSFPPVGHRREMSAAILGRKHSSGADGKHRKASLNNAYRVKKVRKKKLAPSVAALKRRTWSKVFLQIVVSPFAWIMAKRLYEVGF